MSGEPADRNVCPTSVPTDKIGAMKISRSTGGPQNLIAGFHSRNHLPHLKREGGSYFVTIRLAGTLPAEVLLKFKAEREAVLAQAEAAERPLTWQEQEELFRWYSTRVDEYLDAGRGECWLRRSDIADLVAGAIQFHAGQRFDLHAWSVMPNHAHAVFRPLPGWSVSLILKSWKGYTAREANILLNRTGETFWQAESYDHLIRDDEDLHRCCRYTTPNPMNAGLCERPEDWKWSSAYQPRTQGWLSSLPVRATFQSPEPRLWRASDLTLGTPDRNVR